MKAAATCLLLLAILTCFYSLTYSGSFRVDDEHILAARAQSLAIWGDLSFPQVYGNDRVRHLSAISSTQADRDVAIEPFQAILTAGFFKVASNLDLGGVQAGFTLNLFSTAVCGMILFLIVATLGYQHTTAAMCALMFGLGTMAWPFAKTFYRDPIAMLMVALSFLGWARLTVGNRQNLLIDYGCLITGIVGGLFSKQITMVVIPAFLIASLLTILDSGRRIAAFKFNMAFILVTLSALVLLTISLPPHGPLARYSLASYSTALERVLASPQTALLPGFLGPFISPTKSLFLFSPILLLALPGFALGWNQSRSFHLAAALTVLLLAAAQALYLGQKWAGTLAWGLRYMLPALPLMSVLCAPVFERSLQGGMRGRSLLLLALSAVSCLVQLGGVLVAWDTPYKQWLSQGLDPYSPTAVWDATYSVIPVHWSEMIQVGKWDIAWMRVAPIQSATLIVSVCTLALALFSIMLLRAILRGTVGGKSILALSLTVTVVAVLFPILPGLALLRGDPAAGGANPEFEAMLAWIERDVEPSDLIAVDSYVTPLWHFLMNHWSAPVRWYSMPFEIPGTVGVPSQYGADPSPAFLALIQRYVASAERIWYIETDQAPDYALQREKTWLDRHFSLVTEKSFEGAGKVVVSLYESLP